MQGMILIAAVVLLLWGAVVLLRGGPLGGSLLFLLAAACLGSDFCVLEAGPLHMTIDRILWVAVMLQCVVWWQRGWDDPKPLQAADLVLLALVGYLAIRTFTADWQVDGATPVAHLVLSYVMPLGIYWAVRQSRPTERAGTAVLAALAVFGLYLAVTVAAEYFQAYDLVYPRYIVETLNDKKLEFIGRGRGPLLNPIVTGILLAACWSAALLALAPSSPFFRYPNELPRSRDAACPLSPGRKPGDEANSLQDSGYPDADPRADARGSQPVPPRITLIHLAAGLACLLFALAAYCTMTRTVWMGCAASVTILAAAAMPRRWRLPVLGGALLVAALAVAAHWEQIVAFKRDRDLTEKETASSVYLRPVLAVLAWHMFLDHPLFGCGFDQYTYQHQNYLADRSTDLVLEKARGYKPHNVFLAVLTETGLVGLGLLVALLALWARDAWRLWRSAAAPPRARQLGLLFLAALAAYLANGAFHHVAFIPMSNTLLFFLAGVTAAWRSAAPGHLPPSAAPA